MNFIGAKFSRWWGHPRRTIALRGICTFSCGRCFRGTKCEPHLSSQRFAVRSVNLHIFPDLSIVCGPPESDETDGIALVNPSVLIEILSPSTEKYDRGKKFELYRQLESLREYILVAQDEPHIESFLRQDDGSWNLT